MFRILSSLFTTATIIIPLIMYGIILDIGLTSIYAHFGWELWPSFAVIGAVIGLIRGLIVAHWRIMSALAFAFAGYMLAQHWMIDGIIYAVIISAIYSTIDNRCNAD